MKQASRLLVTLTVGAPLAGIWASACGSPSIGTNERSVDPANIEPQNQGVALGSTGGTSGTVDTPNCPAPCTPKACTTVSPSNALITDWKDVGQNGLFVDNDSFSNPNPNWWENFFGGPYVYPGVNPCTNTYPTYPLTQTTNGVLNVQGTVGTWSGFGLWFAPCTVNLSAYQGLSFTIWGDVGSTGNLTVSVNTSEDSVPNQCNTNVGTCDSTLGNCTSPSKVIAVPATPGAPIVVKWTDFTDGSPFAGVNPTQIVGINWSFERVEWAGTVTPPYPVNVTLGQIQLVP